MVTEPSSFWCISRSGIRTRGLAATVLLSEWQKVVGPCRLRRRAVAHVEAAALVVVEPAGGVGLAELAGGDAVSSSSPRPGIQHSMSIMSAFFGPRSAVQHWSRR
jgi:hypothetical protein